MDNHELNLRRAIIKAFKESPEVFAIVGERVYDEPDANPTWPFIRYGVPILTPWRADGWNGAAFALTIHGFAKGPGRDQVTALATAIRNALDEQDFELDGNAALLHVVFSGSQVVNDTAEASAYHAVIEFEAATAEVVDY